MNCIDEGIPVCALWEGGGKSKRGGGNGGSPSRETVGVPRRKGVGYGSPKMERVGSPNSEGTNEKGREVIKLLIKQHKIAVKGTAM
jgi:hypothetical protein